MENLPEDDIFARQAKRSEKNVKWFGLLAALFFLIMLWLLLRDDI